MKQVILTTVADDHDGTGYALMAELFNNLCFCHNLHGEVEAGSERCFVDYCDEKTAYNEALEICASDPEHYDINKLLIREVEI